jgi:hypothetical protein
MICEIEVWVPVPSITLLNDRLLLGRRTEAMSTDAIRNQLDKAQVDVGKLIDLVGHFVVW